ncbi:MFS-type transporter SLC18B1 [Lamellibrachia satsuma]|nr:MFS-type transporter SLC18B1 [Lamellibrachia satsuma]
MVSDELLNSLSVDFQGQSSSPRDVRNGQFGEYSNVELAKLPADGKEKRNRKLIVLTFCASNFFVGTFYALLAPFFAAEAKKKGASATVAGVILGIYEVVIIVLSPVFGNYLTTIGSKFTFVCGIMVCGCGGILFGFLDGCPPGATYIVMCVLVRSIEASGSAAFMTSSFAILANEFPDNVASIFGMLELFSGLGMMAGPPLGGLLYQVNHRGSWCLRYPLGRFIS